jgi:hypothetical protein
VTLTGGLSLVSQLKFEATNALQLCIDFRVITGNTAAQHGQCTYVASVDACSGSTVLQCYQRVATRMGLLVMHELLHYARIDTVWMLQ